MRFSTFIVQAKLIRTRLTNLDSQLNALASEIPLSDINMVKIKSIDETASKKNKEFESLLEQLFSSANPEEDLKEDELIAFQETISDLFMKIHTTCISLLQTLVDKNAQLPLQHNSGSYHPTLDFSGIKLPSINLGTFTGQPEKWSAFYSLFDSTVHSNAHLSKVEKFNYLISCLSGEPLNLIKALPLTSTNYDIAYDQLVRRYNNSRVLVSMHTSNIIDLPQVHDCSVKELRQFLSVINENLSALKALNHDITSESLFLTTFLLRKFNNNLISKFEHSRADSQVVPTITEFLDFVEKECSHLEAANLSSATSASHVNKFSNKRSALFTASSNSKIQSCAYCSKDGHAIYKCTNFVNLSSNERLRFVQNNSLCNNCLGQHNVRVCNSKYSCNICKRRHHSLLHLNSSDTNQTVFKSSDNSKHAQNPLKTARNIVSSLCPSSDFVGISQSKKRHSITSLNSEQFNDTSTVLLGTSLVHLSSSNGKSVVARAILDSAAQQTFITESCAKVLGITSNKRVQSKNIVGISSSLVPTKGICRVNLSSISGHVLAKSHPVVILDKITDNLPRCHVSREVRELMSNLILADPTFDVPAPIDVLLGADLFAHVLNGESLDLGFNMPSALNTIFGYVLIGNTPLQTNISTDSLNLLTLNDFDLHNAVQKFWLTENLPESSKLSPEDQQCENHFRETHSRLPDGKYQVRLPLKQNSSVLGDSTKSAYGCLKSLEKRLSVNTSCKEKYIEFMQDYRDSNHMVPFTFGQPDKPCYFLPHHEVFKGDKIRVVFNASSVTSTGISLNSILHSGPKLHNDIPSIIIGFRRHRIVFTCDVRQMFRNIWLHPDDQNLQLIYWRENPCDPLQAFRLTTVTYGMTSSPFLANRVIQQLIADEGHHHPLAAAALKDQIYVDDSLLGCDTIEEGLQLQEDVIQLMKKGGFSLRKWSSNNEDILRSVPPEHRVTPVEFLNQDQSSCNVLGIKWYPDVDAFLYKVRSSTEPYTKRSVLSTIACLYDPIGWLTPIIFWAKSFMQLLWTKGIQWDDTLPLELKTKWVQFLQELNVVEDIRIPRHLDTYPNCKLHLHGFCDASEAGYCATVYTRVVQLDNNVKVHLLMAKSRVAPLKRVSLPRLELCAAHMLSQLLNYASSQFSKHLHVEEVFGWCDATIVLSWIHTPPYRLKTYVANRVSQIQEVNIPIKWSHISSHHNPADCGSRGLFPSQLKDHHLWWTGPSWLKLSQTEWPTSLCTLLPTTSLPEVKPQTVDALVTAGSPHCEILTRFSSWNRLIRVVAYILRFCHQCKAKHTSSHDDPEPATTYLSKIQALSTEELQEATTRILLITQEESFAADIIALKKNKRLSSRALQKLSPFLDETGLIRVGGRLKHAHIRYNAKHPVLLPKHHFVTKLLIDFYHISYLHCGQQQLQSILCQNYWILSARSVIKSRIFRCIRCYKCKPKTVNPIMANLPEVRVTPTRAFSTSAVDFAGPFTVKLYVLKRLQPIKVYLCIFVCMATKSVHLEVAMDLTSECFIASLTRFISRRGAVSHIHCDNGTNFKGAARQLLETVQKLHKEDPTQNFLTNHGIQFHFNPPSAPHFGGLWERAIQSAKNHMRRVIGEQIFTLEEFITLVCRVEAMLNSRPLTPLSADPGDLEALTPGHFLTGGPLVTLPESNLTEQKMSRLNRWQLVQSCAQHIWKRWTNEYLHTLQNRPKWQQQHKNLQINDFVLIHDDSPPLQWKMGRVTSVMPGKDGVVRVAEIRTATGLLKRPVVKLSLLPLD